MTVQDFSTIFDVLYNNITSNQAPGLNEFEKSVFLTKAQNQLVKEYFNRRTDGFGGGFDGSEQRQYDFSSLIRLWAEDAVAPSNNYDDTRLDQRSYKAHLPEDFFFAVNEIVTDGKWQYSVLPLDYSEYQRLMLKAYSFPVKRGVWRLITGIEEEQASTENPVQPVPPATFDDDEFNAGGWDDDVPSSDDGGTVSDGTRTVVLPVIELIGKFELTGNDKLKYKLRYVQNLYPIILEELDVYQQDLTIEGKTRPLSLENPCVLPKECHQEIIERAVTLAKIAWQGGTMTQAAAASRKSE